MLQHVVGCSQAALNSSLYAACQCCALQQQVPGTFKLAQVLSGSIMQHVRQAAQASRQMFAEPQVDHEHLSNIPTPSEQQHAQHQDAASLNLHQQAELDVQLSRAGAAVQEKPAPLLQQQQHMQVVLPAAVVQPHQPPSPTGVKKTFYKRKLPTPPATEFSSTEGRLLFAEALQQGTMSGFFKLIEQYSTQDEPAFCGLASIAMVLNALSIDPKRPWKGSWRWFHEELLDCCLPLSKVAQEGVVLTQAACLAKCNGANVALHRSGTFSLEEFRQAVIDTCTSGEEHLVVSYTRKAFGQTGDGHFSPIGGYHSARDLVLILDTARFKYPPHWVPLPMLYEAMGAIDPTTGQPRGYLRLSANVRPDSVLFTLDIRPDGSWRQAEAFIQTTAPQLVQVAAAAGQATPEALLQQLVALAPLESVPSFIAMRFAAHSCARDRCVPHTVRQQVLRELRATPLHQALQPLLAQHLAQQQQSQQPAVQQQEPQQQQHQQAEHSFVSEKLTVLLLLQEPSAWGPAELWADPGQLQAWKQLLDASAVSILDGEVGYLRQQLHHIEDVLQVSSSGDSCSSCLGHQVDAVDATTAAVAAAAALQHHNADLVPVGSLGGQPAEAASLQLLGKREVTGVSGVHEAAGQQPGSTSPCSSCIFQHDCSLKGCMNVHGEVEVRAGTGGSAGAALQQLQQDRHPPAALSGSQGCCSSDAGEQGQLVHGCGS